ncbi:MAG: thermosome subunit alpha [Haloferacaceae archaeon]
MAATLRRPTYVLGGNGQRTRGRAARTSNVRAGVAVANAVRTTLGPRGMDKMLVDAEGNVVVTNDGATILAEMDVEHPAARMLVEVTGSQAKAVGDGTTTAAVLAGRLLANAESLLENDVHPTAIVEGYAEAARLALDAVDAATLEGPTDDDLLRVAASSMTGKGTGDVTADVLAERVVRAVRAVHGEERFDRDDVHVRARAGASSAATELIEGVVVDDEPLVEGTPRTVADAAVAVVDAAVDLRTSAVDAAYAVESADQVTAALSAEDRELRGYADALVDAGASVVFCTSDVADRVADHLARAGVLAFEQVSTDDARAVARATGAAWLGTPADVEPDDLGHAERVRVDRFGDETSTVVEGGSATRAVTLLVRGGTSHVVEELERAVSDAVDATVAALDGGVVPGAGSTEVAIAHRVRDGARGVAGREQLAVEAFADAVETIPRTLAENAGTDAIDALVELRATFEREGRAGVVAGGRTGRVGDPLEHGVLDPAAVKREAVTSATEAATTILRIDDVVAAS